MVHIQIKTVIAVRHGDNDDSGKFSTIGIKRLGSPFLHHFMRLIFVPCGEVIIFKILIFIRHDILPELTSFGVFPEAQAHRFASFESSVESFSECGNIHFKLKKLTCSDIDNFIRRAEL